MLNVIFLIIGAFLTIFFTVHLFRGAKYDQMIEALDDGDFPLKSLYSVGFSLQDSSLFALKGKIGEKLRTDSTLIYTKKYSEFYARSIWAQVLSLVFFFMTIGFLLAGIFPGDIALIMAGAGVVLAAVSAFYFFSHTNDMIKARREACEKEFPNAISKLALIVNSGVILHDAWEMVAYGKDGMFYELMQSACDKMNNGMADVDAMYEFGFLTNSDDIKKFTSALIQNIERGGGELPYFLANQSAELWNHQKQLLLQKGEKAASELIMPISIMFLGIMLIVIVAAVQSMSL